MGLEGGEVYQDIINTCNDVLAQHVLKASLTRHCKTEWFKKEPIHHHTVLIETRGCAKCWLPLFTLSDMHQILCTVEI